MLYIVCQVYGDLTSWDVLVCACCPSVTVSRVPFHSHPRATVNISMSVPGLEMVESREQSACFPRADACAGWWREFCCQHLGAWGGCVCKTLQQKRRLFPKQQLVDSSWSLFPKFILRKKFKTLGKNTSFQNLLATWIFKEGPWMILGHIKGSEQFCRDYRWDYKGLE